MKLKREERIVRELIRHFKMLRVQNNWSQNTLAIKAEISRAAVNHIENGKRIPTLLVCLKISRALGKNMCDIIATCERIIDKK